MDLVVCCELNYNVNVINYWDFNVVWGIFSRGVW